MSATETTNTEVQRPCPSCGVLLSTTQTLCDRCRGEIEAQVLSTRAADWPSLMQEATTPQHVLQQISTVATDTLTRESYSENEPDLVPLTPEEDNHRGSTYAVQTHPAAAPAVVAAQITSPFPEPAPPPAPPPSHRPATPRHAPVPAASHAPAVTGRSHLHPSSKWKHVAIAVGCVLGAVGIGGLIWSLVIPGDHMPDTPSTLPVRRSTNTAAAPTPKLLPPPSEEMIIIDPPVGPADRTATRPIR